MFSLLTYALPIGVFFVCGVMGIVLVAYLSSLKQSQATNQAIREITPQQIVQTSAPTLDQLQRLINDAVQRSRADEVRKAAPAPLNRTEIYEHLEQVIGVLIENEVPDETWKNHVDALTQILNGLRRPKKAA